ncbi:unnamed protein product [Tetraodon nigroviridis]|uniref:(spotted green pufferfish) hypothetical protein n=1 Tax=Tetraodon nigroviridis TaxID=99883 RepID=Q4RI27_TETNG|nr:unnamed protein product [Tetraodon nigroviridis]
MTAFYDQNDLEEDLSRVGCGDVDLDFEYLFEYEQPAGDSRDDPSLGSHKAPQPAFPVEDASSYSHPEVLAGYESQEARSYLESRRPAGLALSPRIEITPSREHYSHGRDSLQNQPLNISPRPTLTVPGHENLAYREPQCLSPASSNSSTSWQSESYSPWTSPCVSPSNGQNPGDLCPRLQSIYTSSPRTSPGTSPGTATAEDGCLGARSPSPRPGSRSSSPQGKRTYDMYRNPGLAPGHRSRSPSPHRGHEHPGPQYTHGGLADAATRLCLCSSGSGPHQNSQNIEPPLQPVPREPGGGQLRALSGAGRQSQACGAVLCHPPHLAQTHGLQPLQVKPPAHPQSPGGTSAGVLTVSLPLSPLPPVTPSIPVASLPPLEWPIPGRTDQYELSIEVQPKPHHRAHYETEGSRGAVKAPTGGHPMVQLHGYRGKEPLGLQIFIGTADERILKPHAFYQVHRITGKTVTTTQLREDRPRHQSPGDPPGAEEQHESHNRLCRDPEAQERRHRAEEGRDGRGPEEHACSPGVPCARSSARRTTRLPPSRLPPHRVL